jgi:hypothetical protein
MASLSHSVVFHVGSKDLLMTSEPRIDHPNADPTLWEDGSLPLCNLEEHKDGDKDGRKWFVQELQVGEHFIPVVCGTINVECILQQPFKMG